MFTTQERQKSESITSTPLEVGQPILIFTEMPVGASAKFYNSWKGKYRIKRRADVDSYVVTREGDGRKEFLVHRSRIRPIFKPPVLPETVGGKNMTVNGPAPSTCSPSANGSDVSGPNNGNATSEEVHGETPKYTEVNNAGKRLTRGKRVNYKQFY